MHLPHIAKEARLSGASNRKTDRDRSESAEACGNENVTRHSRWMRHVQEASATLYCGRVAA